MNNRLEECHRAYQDTVKKLRVKRDQLRRWQEDLQRREMALNDRLQHSQDQAPDSDPDDDTSPISDDQEL